MRKLLLLSAILALAGLSACSLFEKDIDATVSTDIFVNESDAGTNMSYIGSAILDAEDDEDIADNLDKIKDWAVIEVGYAILFPNVPAGATFTGNAGFSKAGSNSPEITVAVSNINLGNSSQYTKLNIPATDLNMLASWLAESPQIKVYWNGTLSQTPANFTVEATAKIRIKAKLF
jgi:hypothetical protein